MELIGAFLVATAGAAFLWWLSDRAAARREASGERASAGALALLKEQQEGQERLLLALADRIQSPTAEAFQARQRAIQESEMAKSLTPEERKLAAEKQAEQTEARSIEDYWEQQRWRQDPALAQYTDIDPDGDEVVRQWFDGDQPYMDRVPMGDFLLKFVLSGRRR